MRRFQPLFLSLVFVTVCGLAGAAADPLGLVAQRADEYARQLGKGGGDYAEADRRTLLAAAEILVDKQHCADGLNVIKRALTGWPQPPETAWIDLARTAHCARNWHDAVNAAYLAARAADTVTDQALAFAWLGKSLEAHWNYGATEALAAYTRAAELVDHPDLHQAVERLRRSLAQQQGLRLERHYVQADGARPSICFDFSAGMPDPDAQRYGDYVRFEPPIEAAFRKQAFDEICAEGAAFGSAYQVRLLPGLRGADGNTLAEAVAQTVQVDDRAPVLWFANSRYVLPRGGGVPVYGVNAERARLSLYRVDDRNLLNGEIRRLFRTDISGYQSRRIRDELGEQIWQGEADLSVQRNREAVTNLPLADLAQPKPGVYVLTAAPLIDGEDEEDGGTLAAQWLLVSDVGLTTYRGKDGLTVVSRSLATAETREGVRLALYGRNNSLLAEALSDAQGVARFPASAVEGEGGREAVHLTAVGADGDFNFIDVSGAPFDLSDRGVKGRQVPGPLDAFLYTERGVYRPGETVHLGALLRSDRGLAVDGLPLTVELLRPDEQLAARHVLQSQGAGGYSLNLPLSTGARIGHWKLVAYMDRQAEPIGSVSFLVEAIVPPRIELLAKDAPADHLAPGAQGRFGVGALYLFGAPAADLAATAEVRIEADPDPFPAWSGYRFGLVDEADDSVLVNLDPARTDPAGDAWFDFHIQRLPNLARPLRARFRAEVSDVDGRAVSLVQSVALRHQPLIIGIKPPEGGSVQEGAEAGFEVLALNPAGAPQARAALDYRLIREDVHYQWYRDGGRWQYKRQVRDQLLREGSLAVAASQPGRIGLPLEYGDYRFEVADAETGVASSVRVHAGWQGGAPDGETPDMLGLRSDRAAYQPGETARLRLQSPFTGRADLVIASDRVLSVQTLVLDQREMEIEVPVSADWGAGAYALLSAYRPDGRQAGHGPARAVGVAWIGLDKALHQLDVAIETPEKTLPRRHVEVPVRIGGQLQGQAVNLTLAAVDEGVLQLTDYRSPDPLQHYFGQRELGVGLRDLYGRLIDGHLGSPGKVRSGGGASGRRGAPDSHIRIVSLYSGVVRTDETGRALIPLDLPDFNGRLRLTAVAWSRERVGHVSADLIVRDPVVVMPSAPRFLALGDQGQASVLIHNLEGPEGAYQLRWRADGAVGLGEGATEKRFELTRGQRLALDVPLQGRAIGNGTLAFKLDGPDGRSLTHELKLGVRAAFLPETRRRFGRVAPGASVQLGPEPIQGLLAQTVDAALSVSPRPELDVPGLLRQLDLYPYGCLEQVTSRAFPLLHLQRLGELWGYESKAPVDQRLADAVAKILDKQLDNGGFALWYPGAEEDGWLSAYALDFLGRARQAGAAVPDFAWERGLEWLRRQVTYPDTDQPARMAEQAYALYLLAREGETHPETARYLWDQGADGLPSALAAAQLGVALARMGDAERSARAFDMAIGLPRKSGLGDYGSALRDKAALVQLLAENGIKDQRLGQLVQELAEDMASESWLSTQEQAWLVRAADAVGGSDAPLALALDGVALPPRDKPLVLSPGADALTAGVQISNQGAGEAWYGLSIDGSPADELPALEQGLSITRAVFDLQGELVNLDQIRQGEMLVVVLEGKASEKDIDHQTLIVDPLPAGLEAESANQANARNAGELSWLDNLSPLRYGETLDDRYVAAVDLDSGRRDFRVAYLARAVTPGHYRAPPPLIEDMYKPRYRGRGASGWLRVSGM